jgi:hypothetical protein
MSTAVYPSPKEGALPFVAAILGTIVALVALPIVLLAGGPVEGWLLGFGLWVANWTLQLMTTRFSVSATPTAAVGVTGISLMARAWLVAIVLFLVALRVSEPVALTAAGVFLAAFTFDLTGRALLFGMQSDRTRPPAGTTTDS